MARWPCGVTYNLNTALKKMFSLVNGEPSDSVSISDRGLLYGQSLFETIAVEDGRPCLLAEHLRRLQHGCEVLAIALDSQRLQDEIEQACSAEPHCVLRLTVTMGPAGRGYANPESPSATRIVSTHPVPDHPRANWRDGIVLGMSDVVMAGQPLLAGIKHGNRMEQVLARSQWQAGWQEALLPGQQGEVIEATQSNVFIRCGDKLRTPELDQAGIVGVMREYILNNCARLGFSPDTGRLTVSDVQSADEVFLSNSLIGVWPVRRFKQTNYSDFSASKKLLTLLQHDDAIPNI